MGIADNLSDFELGELTSGDAVTFLIGGLLVTNAKMVYEWLNKNNLQLESKVSPAELTLSSNKKTITQNLASA